MPFEPDQYSQYNQRHLYPLRNILNLMIEAPEHDRRFRWNWEKDVVDPVGEERPLGFLNDQSVKWHEMYSSIGKGLGMYNRIEKIANSIKKAKNIDLKDFINARKNIKKDLDKLAQEREKAEMEYNRRYVEITNQPDQLRKEVSKSTYDAVLPILDKKFGLRHVDPDPNGGLWEIFLGSKDGIKRQQSKVSVHIAYDGSKAGYMLRSEDLRGDLKVSLSSTGTIKNLIKAVESAIQKGFWSKGI